MNNYFDDLRTMFQEALDARSKGNFSAAIATLQKILAAASLETVRVKEADGTEIDWTPHAGFRLAYRFDANIQLAKTFRDAGLLDQARQHLKLARDSFDSGVLESAHLYAASLSPSQYHHRHGPPNSELSELNEATEYVEKGPDYAKTVCNRGHTGIVLVSTIYAQGTFALNGIVYGSSGGVLVGQAQTPFAALAAPPRTNYGIWFLLGFMAVGTLVSSSIASAIFPNSPITSIVGFVGAGAGFLVWLFSVLPEYRREHSEAMKHWQAKWYCPTCKEFFFHDTISPLHMTEHTRRTGQSI